MMMMMNTDEIILPNQSNVRFLLITANTGTVFEKPELLSAWVNEFAILLRRHPADFIALHCQEVGGKDYERFMHILDPFIKDILQIPEIATDFTRHRLYFDSDYTSQDTFTALGSAYFIRQHLPIQQWNFTTSSFHPVVNRQIFTGNLANVQSFRKEKFPREFFPEAKWSRKGFTQTRWSINDFIFDMVNVHLFHDASNLLAAEQSPSIYSQFRKNALQYTLRKLPLNDSDSPIPFAIFGDFNFRLDAHRLVEHIAEKRNCSINKIKRPESEEILKIVMKNPQNKTKLTIEKKEFNFYEDHDTFFADNTEKFHTFDAEFASFTDQLFEYEKKFPPSYPYSEEHDEARSYLRARCPAWCDRILLNHLFNKRVDTKTTPPAYNIVGEDVCMGDHKPVYLALTVDLVQGWSSSPLFLASVFSSSPCFSSDCEERFAISNRNPCVTSISPPFNPNSNPSKSPVTATRKTRPNQTTDLILNDICLLSNESKHFNFNVHDYAIFVQPTLLPQCPFVELRQRSSKTTFNSHSSSALWAKVRAVTYMTTLAHRTGSWYSDDQTEKSLGDADNSSSISDHDENDHVPDLQLNDLQNIPKADLSIPLRRSFSSIDYVKHDENYSSSIARSRSTTLINATDRSSSSSPVTEEPPSPLSSPPTSSRVYRFLHCIIL